MERESIACANLAHARGALGDAETASGCMARHMELARQSEDTEATKAALTHLGHAALRRLGGGGGGGAPAVEAWPASQAWVEEGAHDGGDGSGGGAEAPPGAHGEEDAALEAEAAGQTASAAHEGEAMAMFGAAMVLAEQRHDVASATRLRVDMGITQGLAGYERWRAEQRSAMAAGGR